MSAMPSAQPHSAPRARASIAPGDHLILVDGSTFMFRAFFAIQMAQRMSRKDGLPTGAVLVFCNMVWKILQEGPITKPGAEASNKRPTHFGVVFDYSAQTFATSSTPTTRRTGPTRPPTSSRNSG
jgi:DNA polymerase-1